MRRALALVLLAGLAGPAGCARSSSHPVVITGLDLQSNAERDGVRLPLPSRHGGRGEARLGALMARLYASLEIDGAVTCTEVSPGVHECRDRS